MSGGQISRPAKFAREDLKMGAGCEGLTKGEKYCSLIRGTGEHLYAKTGRVFSPILLSRRQLERVKETVGVREKGLKFGGKGECRNGE